MDFTEEELSIIESMLDHYTTAKEESQSQNPLSNHYLPAMVKTQNSNLKISPSINFPTNFPSETQKENLHSQHSNNRRPDNSFKCIGQPNAKSFVVESGQRDSVFNLKTPVKQSPFKSILKKPPPKEIDPETHKTDAGKNNGLFPFLPCDTEAAQFWVIYCNSPPPNLSKYYLRSKSFRLYQFRAVETCLFYNTFVSLPTGLGKTFIAANVILNYYKWFPTGKIFFLAPTKPLVHQQKEALECIKSMKLDDLCQLNGMTPPKKRAKIYEEKRVFFLTPQTMHNDLDEKLIDPQSIVLIVIDEAHKGIGKFAYTEIIKHTEKANVGIRIVALSATPGNNSKKIQEVLNNLCIARLEAKDEDDPDVKPYVYAKDIKEIVVKQSIGISNICESFNQLITVATKTINSLKLFPVGSKLYIQNPWDVNRRKVVEMAQYFNKNQNECSLKIGAENCVLFYGTISTLTSLCYMRDILNDQGLQSFQGALINFKNNYRNKNGNVIAFKKNMIDSSEFKDLLQAVEVVSKSGDKHPKLRKLFEVLSDYFTDPTNIKNKSRVMIFTQNRASAIEINEHLQKNHLIRSSIFVGHSKFKGLSSGNAEIKQQLGEWNQKKQIDTLTKFRNYELNTLIATCIGEEGLDIGEVDMIVCYDSGFSPIRMVQRMGRTGRKREGKVIVLLMEGREYLAYKASMQKKNMVKEGLKKNSKASNNNKNSRATFKIGQKPQLANFRFYSFNPRMIPEEITPKLKFIDEIDEIKVTEKLEGRREEKKTDESENFEEILNFRKDEENSMVVPKNTDLMMMEDSCQSINTTSNSISRNGWTGQSTGEEDRIEEEVEQGGDVIAECADEEEEADHEDKHMGIDGEDEANEELDLDEIDRLLSAFETNVNTNSDSKKRVNPFCGSILDENKKMRTSLD